MLNIQIPAEEFKALAAIGPSATLHGISLRSVKVEEKNIDLFFNLKESTPVNLNIEHRTRMKDLVEGQSVSGLILVEVKLTKKDSNILFLAEYLINYALPPVPFPKELNREMFESFVRHNGLYNCWPFIRTLLNSLSSEVGVPFMLPLMKLVPAEATKSNDKNASG